jgi:SPP1 gp7 family putative phage head morphogenesis protein
MSIPEVFFRETIDLNRYSNAVSTEFQTTYNDIILVAAKKLKQLNIKQAQAGAGVVVAPQTRKRLRAIIAQSKASLNTWSKTSTKQMIREIEGLADIQAGFIENELKKVVKSGNIPINSVAVSPKYAESFVKTDPTKTNIFTSKEFTEDDFKKFGQGKFELTARQGAMQTLPNGVTVEKAFRGIAERQQDSLARHIRQGVFSGESTAEIARRMVGKLEFGQRALSSRQKALAGGELTKLANHQIRTIVRTSVNQVQNQASQAVYAANSKVAPEYQYVATLDSRTSAVCRDLDGKTFAYNRGPTPPQHFNCRSTTVPVVDFDKLQKQYPTLEKPPVGKAVTRPSATGRVPQDTTYGEWLLKQDKKLQVKTLGNEKKVNYFKRLAKKEGSGQKAIKKLVRDDDSERSLKDLQRIYGKPTNIKPKPKPKPKAVVGTAVVSDFVKSKPLKRLTEKELLADLKKFREHERKIQISRGIKNPSTGPIDAKIERLEKGLSIERAIDKNSPMYNDYLFWKQGFNKRPDRVKNVKALKDRTDLVKGADGENLLVYRGVSNDKWSDEFKGIGKTGDHYYVGNGIYGNGSYAASRNIHGTKAMVKQGNQNAFDLAENYTASYGSTVTAAEKKKRITAFGFKKGANLKTWEKGASTKSLKGAHAFPDSDWYRTTFKEWENETIAKATKLTGYKVNTVGEACTILGIDGYQVPLPLVDEVGDKLVHWNLDYWVILNRSAIVVSDTVGL